jgi:glutathione S-transferase
MAMMLYELDGREGRRFSTNSWRIKLALAHKGLAHESTPTPFTRIGGIGDGSFKTVPVLDDNGTWVGDSWNIATYLEKTYPDRPSLFGGDAGRDFARFIQHWQESQLSPFAITLIVTDLYASVVDEDREYFRKSREQRLGKPLEEAVAGREKRVEGFRKLCEPLRRRVSEAPFLGGERPMYADYVAFGPFMWARAVTPFRLVERDDPVNAWFQRCLDLYDGLARHSPGFD